MNLDFQQWSDIFVEYCKKTLKYSGLIDIESFKFDWEMGTTPEDAAREFVEEMTDE